jgi:hypothetical protein
MDEIEPKIQSLRARNSRFHDSKMKQKTNLKIRMDILKVQGRM